MYHSYFWPGYGDPQHDSRVHETSLPFPLMRVSLRGSQVSEDAEGGGPTVVAITVRRRGRVPTVVIITVGRWGRIHTSL